MFWVVLNFFDVSRHLELFGNVLRHFEMLKTILNVPNLKFPSFLEIFVIILEGFDSIQIVENNSKYFKFSNFLVF